MDEDTAVGDARRRLLAAILAGRPRELIERRVKVAQWVVPSRVTIASVELEAGRHPDDLPSFGTGLLVGVADHRLAIVGPDDAVRDMAARLHASPAVRSVAVSWAAPVDEVPLGYQRTRQALDLHGLVGSRGFVECSRPSPWLADGDPAHGDLLASLNAESPHNRLVLAETLQLWLQTRESAPGLARRLGTHENTIRRRLKVLKGTFGDALQDPEQTLPLLSALEARLPQWRETETRGEKPYRRKT